MNSNGKYVFATKISGPILQVPKAPQGQINLSLWRNINWADMNRVTSSHRSRVNIDGSVATIDDKKFVISTPKSSDPDLLIPRKKIIAFYKNNDWAGEEFIIYDGGIAQRIVYGSGFYMISNDLGTLTKV
jgi:hypothetical protein